MSTEERIEKLEERLERIEDSMTAIRVALLGGEYNAAEGFLKRHADLERRVQVLEKYVDRWKWFLIGLSIAAGIGGASVLNAVASFISKIS